MQIVVFSIHGPRQRGIPRRGGISGTRGGQGDRGISAPCRISPLAKASPSSPPSEESDPSLNSSLHTSRFTFKSRLNKPLLSAIITVIFSEEEDEKASSNEDFGEHRPSQNTSASQSSSADDSLKVSAMVHDEDGQGEAGSQFIPPPENIIPCEPANRHVNALYPVLPPGVTLEDIGDGVMIDWEPAPDEANDNVYGESPKA